MKRYCYLLATTLAGLSLASCISPQGRPDYTASGTLTGGATGAIIGSMAGHSGSGAAIGAMGGALIGGLIGHGMDQEQEARLRAQAPQTFTRVEQSQPLTTYDVKSLIRAGISDDLVISQIRNSRTVYHLNTAEIVDLKNAGVSETIIDFMINTPTQIQSSEVSGVVGNLPPAPIYEPYYIAPSPGFIWIDGSWFWGVDRWTWRRGYWHRPHHQHQRRWR
jgi:hypothetical protein